MNFFIKLYKLSIITYFFFTVNLNAQEKVNMNIKSKKVRHDTSKVVDMSHKLALYANTISKFHNIEMKNIETTDKLKLKPNGQTNVGLGFNYKWLGLGVSFSLPFMNKDDEIYGETKRFDTQLNIFSRWFGIDAHLQYYKGFYLENPKDFQDWNEEFYPQIGDIEALSLGIAAYYFFNNKNFSYKAAFTRTQIQKKSAGAFILGGFYNLDIALAPSSFVPSQLNNPNLANDFDINAYSTAIIGLSIGYTYTFVVKRFFINLSLVPGFGARVVKLWAEGTEHKISPSISASITSRVAIGYEGKHLYWGLNIINTTNSYKHEEYEISSSTGNVKLYIGKRFNFSSRRKKKIEE